MFFEVKAMKRFLVFASVALIIFVLALTSTFTLTVSADSGNAADNVVFVSDSAVEGGKGTSASDPLYPTILPEEELEPSTLDQTQSDGTKKTVTIYANYKNTALYQAVEKLAETGGTVVICGDYTIDDSEARQSNYWSVLEYHLPETKKPVTITSKYNGVDYGAKLTLSGYFYTILNGPTVWENLNLHANLAADRAICCNGNKTVFGEGLVCTKTNTTSNAYFLSIAGGERYSAINKDIDVTIKSGTFYKFVGTTWTNPGSEKVSNCDVNLKLEGGTVSSIYGNSHNTVPYSLHAGNVNITVTGGKLTGLIAATGNGGFKTESSIVNIKITGGTLSSGVKILSRNTYNQVVTGVEPTIINVDLSAALNVSDSALNSIVTNLPANANVIYPNDWMTENREVLSVPNDKFAFVGDVPSSVGASVKVEYKNPVTQGATYLPTMECDKNQSAFTVKCDTSKAGKAIAEYYFGTWKYHEAEIDVVAVPDVVINGVQIRINTEKQQMYGWGGYKKGDYPDITIKESGILALPSDMLTTQELFDHSNTYGMYDAKLSIRSQDSLHNLFGALVFGDDVVRENNYDRDYSLRAYVKFEYAGEEYYRYSDVIQRSFYDVAKQAIAGDMEDSATKEWLQENVIDVHNNYDPTYLYNPEGSAAARQKVVDYMYKMSDIEWTPKETFIIYNEGTYNDYSVSTGSTRMYGVFYAGKVYHGIPYVNKTLTQYESYLDMIDKTPIIPLDNPNLTFNEENGIVDFDNLTPEQKAAGLENAKNFPGNDCWAGLIFAWNSVLNNRESTKKLTSIDNMLTLDYGTVKVGDYEIDEQYIVSGRNNTKAVVAQIDSQVMAEAYAKLQPGDATAHSTQIFDEETQKYTSNGRHVRIVTGVEVKKKLDISWSGVKQIIDLEKSKVHFIHQAGGGTSVYIYNENDRSLGEVEKTFQALINEGSLPMSIPELMTGNVDTPMAIASGVELEGNLENGVLKGVIKANKQMISVRAVFSQNGQPVSEKKELLASTYGSVQLAEYNLKGLDLSGIELKAGEEYTFDLYTCISGLDGQEIHLVDGYEFTAK